MKSMTKRKITAVAVSLMLIVAVVATGILCAPDLNKFKENGELNIANTAYDAYGGDYKVGRVGLYNAQNSKVIRIADQEDNSRGADIWYPTDIYLDTTETLQSAGYYFYFQVKAKTNDNAQQLFFHNALGKHSESMRNNVGADAKAFEDNFSGYGLNAMAASGSFKSFNGNDSATPGGGNSDMYNNVFLGVASKNENPEFTVFLNGTPNSVGEYNYKTATHPQSDLSNSKVALYEIWYKVGSLSFNRKRGLASDFTVASTSTINKCWTYYLNEEGNYVRLGDNSSVEIPKKLPAENSDTTKTTPDMEIKIHIYDKTPLLEALTRLESSYNDLKDFTLNKKNVVGNDGQVVEYGAEDLIASAKSILRTRETNDEAIKALTKLINEFEFKITRPNTTATGWQYGADDHKGATSLNVLWNTYNKVSSKYFDVTINNTVVNPLNENEKEVVNTPVNSYSDAVVRDAGNYEITFTPKAVDLNNGIYHKVIWSADKDNATSKMTLSIARAQMILSPAVEAARPYTASPQAYSMLVTNATVELKDGMQATDPSSKLVIKLSSASLALNNNDWNSKGDTVSFTEVGTHTVYGRVEVKNHNPQLVNYQVEISKANVSVTLDRIIANGSGKTLTYGDPLLSSEDILSLGVSGITINGSNAAGFVTKSNISSMITAGVYSNGEFLSGNLVPAGSYSIARNQYKAVDKATVLDGKTINNWGDRMILSFSNPDNAYVIGKKEVTLTWTENADKYYNGQSGHRPSATVNGLVSGGDTLDINASRVILTGQDATAANGNTVAIPDGFAGVRNIDGENHFVPLSDGGNAVWAGKYWLKADYHSNNYTVRKGDETVSFDIIPRDLAITAKDKTRTYAQSMNSSQFLYEYQHTLFNGNDKAEEADKVYEITSGTLAGGDAPDQVFMLDIVGVPTTGGASTDPDDHYYVVGTYTGALKVKPAKVDSSRVLDYVVNSYSITATDGTFTVNPATIRSTREDVQLTFNGEEQGFALPNVQGVIEMRGYEAKNRDDITITYSSTLNGNYTEVLRTWRDYNNANENRTVYYKISAPNHVEKAGNFQAIINKLDVTINVNKYGATYGDKLPTAGEMEEKFGITYSTSIDKDGYKFSIDGRIAFFLSHSGNEVTDADQLGVGAYSLNHKAMSGEYLYNYNIDYTNDSNVEAYSVSPKTVYVDWRQQTSDGWLEDGKTWLYDGTLPKIYPHVRKYVKIVDGQFVDTSDVKVGDDWVENVVYNDTIVLAEQDMGGYVYKEGGYPTAETSLINPDNVENYRLFNASDVFHIKKREVIIDVFDISKEYGLASTVAMGQLDAAGAAGANWKYHTDNADNKFILDHYMNWTLTSTAQIGKDGVYQNYREGGYPIVLGFKDGVSADGEIVRNYDITVYRAKPLGGGKYEYILSSDHGNVATFMIEKSTELGLTRREFNFDADPEKNEPDGINIANDLKSILKFVGGTKADDINVQMSVIINKDEETDTRPTDLDMSQTEVHAPNAGRWYVWVSLANSNYEPFETKVYINYLTNWVDIKLGSAIQVNYGDRVLTSDELFEKLGENLVSVNGMMNDTGNDELDDQAAWAKLKQDYITLFVGDGSTTGALDTNDRVAFYSVFMQLKAGVPNGDDDLHFRFVGDVIGSGKTSNIDVYEVIPRPVWIQWLGSLDEVYGNHGDQSASHTNYTISNIIGDDDVRETIRYDVLENGGKLGTHIHDVGKYRAVLTGVTHQNYRVANVGDVIYSIDGGDPYTVQESDLQCDFVISQRQITVTIKDRTLEYGSADARRQAVTGTGANNIVSYLNSTASYTIGGDGLYRADSASKVFSLSAEGLPQSGFNYIEADTYAIVGTVLNSNYNVTFVNESGNAEEGTLTVTPAEFTISSITFPSVYFDGNQHSPLAVDSALVYQFRGGEAEQKYAFDNRTVEYKLINVSSDIEDETGWVSGADFKFRNAGLYEFAVRVNAPNHKARIRTNLTFEIRAVNVTINMPGKATKEYGRPIGDRTEKDISDHIKRETKVEYTVTAGGKPVTIANIGDSFIFYVVAGGEQGADGGDPTEANNFANSVGNYRVYHKFAKLDGNEEDERRNYIVEYAVVDGARCNASAFVITPQKISVQWFDGDHITGQAIGDGCEFTYTGRPLTINAYIQGTKWDGSQQVEDWIKLGALGIEHVHTNLSAGIEKYTAEAVLQSGETTANYQLESNISIDYKIVPLKVNVTIFNTQQVTYGFVGEPVWDKSNTAWQAEGVDLSNPGITLSLQDLPTSGYVPVKDYRIAAEWTNLDYDIEFSEAYLHVVPADITVNVQRNTVTYDGSVQTVDLKSYIAENVEERITLAGDMGSKWNTASVKYSDREGGEYTDAIPGVEGVTGADGAIIYYEITIANHNTKYGRFTLVVNKARVVYSADPVEVEYGQTALTSDEIYERMNISVKSGTLAVDLKDIVKFSIRENAVDAGRYALVLEYENSYIEIALDDSSAQDPTPYHIVPKTITADWGTASVVYNGDYQLLKVAGFEGLVGNDRIEAPTYINHSQKDVGKYEVTIVVLSNNPNYKVSEESRTVTYEILPREVEITWSSQTTFVYDGEAHGLTATVGGLLFGDECDVTVSAPQFSAGTHTASITSLTNSNYKAVSTQEFTILPAEVNIVWDVASFAYNGNPQCPTAHVDQASLFGSDVCEVIVGGANANAGTHIATVVELLNKNYRLPEEGATCEFAISPKVITAIVWSNTTLEYKELNNTPQSQAPIASGVGAINGDVVEFDVIIDEGVAINVGSYTARAFTVKNPNYTLSPTASNTSVSFNITKAANSFIGEIVLPDLDGGLPALADFASVSSKYGNATVKYYTDAALTQEYTENLADAPKGKYYVVVTVDGNQNYDGISKVFEVEVKSGSNVGLVLGIIIPVVILAAAAVVAVIVVKKKKGGKQSA